MSASRLLMATSGTRMPEFMGSPLDKIYEGRTAGASGSTLVPLR